MALGRRKPYVVQPDDGLQLDPVVDEGPRYLGVGAQLRDARLAYGRSAAEIGQALRIKPAHIEALERGEIDGTPGLTYALGYLRSYAAFLGFDGDAMVAAFKAELNREPEQRPLVFPAPVQEVKFPTGRVLSLSVVLAVLVYGGYYYLSRTNTLPAEAVPAVPAELATPETLAETPAPSDPTAAQAAQPPTGIAASSGTASSGTASSGSMPSSDALSAAPTVSGTMPQTAGSVPGLPALTVVPGAPAVPGALPQVLPAPPGSAPLPMPTDVATPKPAEVAATPAVPTPVLPAEGRVVLKATASAWVQIVGEHQDVIFTKILRAGESYTVPARPDAMLVTGNAGALEVVVDGKSMGALGTLGQVRRNIPLDPEKLLNGAAKPPA